MENGFLFLLVSYNEKEVPSPLSLSFPSTQINLGVAERVLIYMSKADEMSYLLNVYIFHYWR